MATTTTFSKSVQLGNGNLVTAWLPLSTPWPSIASCSAQIYAKNLGPGGTLLAYDPLYGQSIFPLASTQVPCLPPQVTSSWQQNSNPGITTLLGPIFVCPAAYSAVQTILINTTTQHILCCPSQYTLSVPITGQAAFPSQCSSTITLGQLITYVIYTTGTSTVPSSSVPSGILSSSIIWGMHVNGYNVLSTSTSTMTSDLSTPPAPSSTSTSATSTLLPSTTTVSSTGLSTGVAEGVGIGVAVAAVVLATVLFFFYRRAKKRHRPNKVENRDSLVVDPGHELKRFPLVKKENTVYGFGSPPVELDSPEQTRKHYQTEQWI